MKRPGLTIIVSGMVAADPYQGGATWAVLQYVLGFRRLGHTVYFIEPLSSASLKPAETSLEISMNATYFRHVMASFQQEPFSALVLSGTHETVGLTYSNLVRVAQEADLLINISGMLADPELIADIPVPVYLDLDPAFNQFWHTQGVDMRLDGHSHFVTVGQAIGSPACPVPTCGRTWLTTFQPVVLDLWPQATAIRYDGLTTVGNWRGYGSIEHGGVIYGQKVHSLRRFLSLPKKTREKFMLALAIHPGEVKDLRDLTDNSWQILDPGGLVSTPAEYQQFIQASKAEFGIAKSGYVASRCGWFSDRSACYLASGRPVLAQETGFSDYLPTGAGLFAFTTEDDVITAIASLDRDYGRHQRAARALAEEYFDSDKVLGRLLRNVGVLP
jgi:hypothetical protein